MSAKRYPDEIRQRAVRMVFEVRKQTGEHKGVIGPGRPPVKRYDDEQVDQHMRCEVALATQQLHVSGRFGRPPGARLFGHGHNQLIFDGHAVKIGRRRGRDQGQLSFNRVGGKARIRASEGATRWWWWSVDSGVIIVGAGISGLGLAITLRRAGHGDFIVLEKASDLGGTWRDNDYPGCASDVPAHIYSFSFAMDPDWPQRYGPQPKILQYLRGSAERFGVLGNIRFNTTVTSATFDPNKAQWIIDTESGTQYRASALVLAVGALHRPAIPDIPGLRSFTGSVFHTSAWDHDCELTDRSVAVIGTGASSIQIVPKIAPRVGRLYVFQRTAPWVLPRRDEMYSLAARALLRRRAILAVLYRWYLYWRAEARVLAYRRHKWLLRVAHLRARRHLDRQVVDSGLRGLLTPDYAIGCKQLLLSNAYYPALTRSNVELVTVAIANIGDFSITTIDGVTRPIDVVILATGFQTIHSLDLIQVTGRDGVSLKDTWRTGAEAYLGVCVAGFPNLFLMVGPNSGLAHTSMIFMIEAQARYITRALNRLDHKIQTMEVDLTVQRKFNDALQRQLRHAVWSGGCRSWYLDANGINRMLWPNSTVSYWLRTRRVSDRDFIME